MKYTFVLIASCMYIMAAACQSDLTLMPRADSLEALEADPDYFKYQVLVHNNLLNILYGQYDMEAIGKVIYSFPEDTDICQYTKEDMADARGGAEWVENQCQMAKQMRIIEEKHPVWSTLTERDFSELGANFVTNNPEYGLIK